jgi:hypothetical protein
VLYRFIVFTNNFGGWGLERIFGKPIGECLASLCALTGSRRASEMKANLFKKLIFLQLLIKKNTNSTRQLGH